MKAVKQQVRDSAIERQQNEEAYIMLSFSSYEAKEDFAICLVLVQMTSSLKEKMY